MYVRIAAAIVVLVFCRNANAYKEVTHSIVSEHAVEQSVLNDPSYGALSDLSLKLEDSQSLLPSTSIYPLKLTPRRLILRGAVNEDAGHRSLNHFFDPQNNGRGLQYLTTESTPSPLWILGGEDQDEDEISYSSAKLALREGLVGPNETVRNQALGKAFEALGHVIHHLQDMAQPQHVRNDVHCDQWTSQIFDWSWLRLPVCPATVAYRPSAYEDYTLNRGQSLPLAGYIVPDHATFSDPSLLWSGGGRGMAEFTSNNFVSVGTNFYNHAGFMLPDPEYPKPRGVLEDPRQITDPDLLGPQGPNQPLSGEIRFVATSVVDNYRGANETNTKAATYSIFDKELKEAGDAEIFALNSLNYKAANEFLLPRAAAYSASLINYFFRGRIEIGLPADGVYGVIDHATTYAARQGFGKLKLKLRNASADGERPLQTMEGGTLVAIAKYTLNSCYMPDLTGDFAATLDTGAIIYPANCTLNQYFAGDEQISQSAAMLGTTLTTTAAEFEFDFSSQPIPVNARDLRIQVVYTGQLGAEADGIAFGGRDISEPTHVVVYNNSDYYAVDGKFYTPSQIRSDPTLTQRTQGQVIDPRALRDVSLAFATGRFVAGPSTQPVAANGYLRVAVLADRDRTFNMSVRLRFEGGSLSTSTFTGIIPATIDLRGEPAYITPFGLWRGMRVHMVDVAYRAADNVPLGGNELAVMSTRDVPDPGPTQIPVKF